MGVRQVFRENLKHYRREKGLSQEKLSELIGFGETYITEIESRHKFPKPETIDIIAKELEIEPYLFFKPMDDSAPVNENELIQNEIAAEFSNKLRVLQHQINDLFEITASQ